MLCANNTIKERKSKTNLKSFSFSSLLISVAIFFVMIAILTNPRLYAQSVINGISLFFKAVFPGLLPFMFLSKILVQLDISSLFKPLNKITNRFFGINHNGFYAFFMSCISGYPIGAKITNDLYRSNYISDNETTKVAILSSTSGPIFVIGTVGALMLDNIKYGIIIYISNILAVILYSILLNLFNKKSKKQSNYILKNNCKVNKQAKQPVLKVISNCAIDTIKGLLTVGFYISIFSLFIELLNSSKILIIIANCLNKIFNLSTNLTMFETGVMSGIIEMTTGIKAISNNVSSITLCFISFLTGFSGLSIIMQSLTFINESNIKPTKFIVAKLFHGLLSFILCFCLVLIFL